jgi:two-component system LytT family response regulator
MKTLPQAIRTLVVEDEQPSRDALISYIGDYCPDLEVVGSCKSVREAHKAILEQNPDLVFLDIEMPRASGFELLKKFKKVEFSVIFVTAFSEYATKAFRVSATDFLLKPVRISELVEAVSKVKQNFMIREFSNLETLLENIENPSGQFHKLIIPNQKGFTAVNIKEVIMCVADGYCTGFYLEDGKKLISSHHLKYYEELLPAQIFQRVHNSYIINLNHVTGYSHQGVISLSKGLQAPLSKNRKDLFLQCWKTRKR